MGRIVSASDGLFWRLLLIGALSSLFVGLASSYFRIRFVHQFLQQLHWEVPAELDSVQLTEPPARDLLSLLFPQMQTLRLDASGRELGSGRPLIRSSDLHALLSKPLPELPIYSLPRDPTGASALTSVYPIPSLDGDKQLLCLVRNDVEPVSLLHALRSLPSVIAPVLLMLLGTTGVAVASSSRLLRGYNALRTIIEDLRHGNYSHTLGPAPSDELGQLEHQLIDLGASVSARENQIRTTRDERRTILGEIVHDARGPITACRGFMDSVLVTSTASNSLFLDQCFAGIRNSLRSYIALADRLRVAAAADEPARTGVLEIASVAEAVEETAARLLASARNRSIDLTVRSETSQALPIDRLLIERAVMNLLENALKFTPPGGKIDVATVADASHVTITVSDTGPGIPADLLPRIFDRYVHAGSAGQSGHGIGLATVKEIAAIHHGTVSVSSNSEDGTTFAISLPFTDFTQTQERVLETAPPLQPLRDLDGSRFVVAASLIVATTIAIVEKESAALALVGAPALILGTWYATRRNSAARTTESAYQRVQTKLFATFILFWTLGISWAAKDPRSPWSLSYCAGTGMLSGFGSALIKRHPLAGWISLLPSFILITLRIVENDLVAFIFILSLAIGATVRIIAPREREMRLGLRSMVLLLVVIVISILLSGYSMNLMWRNSSSSLEVAGMQGIAARIAPLLEKSHTATNQLSLASSERLLSEVARLKKSFDLYLIDANGSVLFKSGWYSFPGIQRIPNPETIPSLARSGIGWSRDPAELRSLKPVSAAPVSLPLRNTGNSTAPVPQPAFLYVVMENQYFNTLFRKLTESYATTYMLLMLVIGLGTSQLFSTTISQKLTPIVTRIGETLAMHETGMEPPSPHSAHPLVSAVEQLIETIRQRTRTLQDEDTLTRELIQSIGYGMASRASFALQSFGGPVSSTASSADLRVSLMKLNTLVRIEATLLSDIQDAVLGKKATEATAECNLREAVEDALVESAQLMRGSRMEVRYDIPDSLHIKGNPDAIRRRISYRLAALGSSGTERVVVSVDDSGNPALLFDPVLLGEMDRTEGGVRTAQRVQGELLFRFLAVSLSEQQGMIDSAFENLGLTELLSEHKLRRFPIAFAKRPA